MISKFFVNYDRALRPDFGESKHDNDNDNDVDEDEDEVEDEDEDEDEDENENDNQPYLVRVTLASKADKTVALISG